MIGCHVGASPHSHALRLCSIDTHFLVCVMRPPAETEPAKAALRGGVFPQRGSSLAIYQELKARVQRPDALRQARCVLPLWGVYCTRQAETAD